MSHSPQLYAEIEKGFSGIPKMPSGGLKELAITLSVGDVFMDVVHEYPDINVHLTLFDARIEEGVPKSWNITISGG